jgi:hypothetical protein
MCEFSFKEVEAMNKIAKLSLMRRNILLGVLAGTGIAFVLLLYPFIVPSGRYLWWPAQSRMSFPFYYWAFAIWLLTLVVFIVLYRVYKRKLRKDPALRAAVDDERVKVNWLKAYRFGFCTLVIITVLMKVAESALAGAFVRGSFPFPDSTWLLLSGAVLSLVSSFLYYNRETQDE